MKKNHLLIASAIAALIAGGGIAAGQGAGQGGSPGGGMNAPAEKMAPSSSQKGGSGATQMNERGGARSEQHRGSETTGQAPSQPGAGSANQGRQQSADEMNKSRTNDRGGARSDQHRGETTGQAPNQQGAGSANQGRQQSSDEMNRSRGRGNQAQENKTDHGRNGSPNRNETTGQAPGGQPNQPGNMQRNEPPRSGQMNERGPSGQMNERGAAGERGTSTSTSVNLSSDQRTRIHQVIVSDRGAPRVNNVDFALSVGTAVPRSVKLARLPSSVIEIEPRWRGYEYFMVGDQIVVVDPNSLHIVAVINA